MFFHRTAASQWGCQRQMRSNEALNLIPRFARRRLTPGR